MSRILACILLTCAFGLIASCNPQSEGSWLLRQACAIIEEHPDSALGLIGSIRHPESSLTKGQYMDYLLARVQAQSKNYHNFLEDTLIFKAERHFTQQNKDPLKITLTKFYSGAARRNQGKYESAMMYYKEAETYANKIRKADLQGQIQYSIGDLFYEKMLYRQALERYRIASVCYQPNPEKLAYSLKAMGRVFLILSEVDSALHYFHLALDIAENIAHRILQSNLVRNLAVIYKEAEDDGQSEKYQRLAMRFDTDSTDYPRFYLDLAKLFHRTSQIDSAQRYVKKLKESIHGQSDRDFEANTLRFLIEWEKEQGDYDAAFSYQERYATLLTEIIEDHMRQSIYEVEQKYNYEQMQTQYYQLHTNKQLLVIAVLIILFGGGSLFMKYWIVQRNKQLEIKHDFDVLSEINIDLGEVLSKKQRDSRRDLLWRLDIANKLVKLNKEIGTQFKNNTDKSLLIKRFNSMIYGETIVEDQWEVLLQIFKKARPGYVEQIRVNYPNLKESEFRICILTYVDFSVKEIAVILQQSPNTIQTRRTTLRQKLGLCSGGNIADHIDQMFI